MPTLLLRQTMRFTKIVSLLFLIQICVTKGFVPFRCSSRMKSLRKTPNVRPVTKTCETQRHRTTTTTTSTTVFHSYTAPRLEAAEERDNHRGGAPPLPVLCTNDSPVIERWLNENIDTASSKNCILGFDTESIAKADWFPERKHLPDGPACIQLSTVDSTLIVHLARCGDGTASSAPKILQEVLADPSIIKAGVGIDDDALEVYRWGKQQNGADEQAWEIRSRFDLAAVAGGTAGRRMGLRQLTSIVLNVDLPKSRKLAMSNWGARRLSDRQVAYAARDAWAAAAVVQVLEEMRPDVFGPDALLKNVLNKERALQDMDVRSITRRAAKLELKAIKLQEAEYYQKVESDGNLTDKDKNPTLLVSKEEKDRLWKIMDESRPDPPPVFNSKELGLPW